MKRILIISDVAPPQVNGVQRTLQNTVKILIARGHTVSIAGPPDFRSFPLPFYNEIRLALPPYDFRHRLRGYDAIHIATEGPLGFAARNAANRLRLPYTTAYHTNFPLYLNRMVGVPESASYRYLRWFHKHSRAVMANTPSMINLLKSKGFQNVVHWGRGVDGSLFHPRSNVSQIDVGPRPYFLNVGRVSPEKNLEAFLELNLPGTKIVIGDGPSRVGLQKAYPDVVFLGTKEGVELAEWYNRADVFVFPSKSDTYGLVIAEAIASGVPVAAYPAPGPIDIIEPGVTGILSENLEYAAISAIKMPMVARDFSWEIATNQFFRNLCFI